MAADSMGSGWPPQVIAFLQAHLPRLEDGPGWDHMSSTPYQFGCMALVALGQATETAWGAVPRQPSQLPKVLPRWDDICVAVLSLAAQSGKLGYRGPGGAAPAARGTDFIITQVGAPPAPLPNIAAAHGLGSAHAAPDVLALLQALGLIADGRWTAAAEPVLWRKSPRVWFLDFQNDLRFAAVCGTALRTLPDGIAAQIDRLVTITDSAIADAVRQSAEACDKFHQEHGPMARINAPHSAERARAGLVFQRRHELDWLFFRHWRLEDGWLTPASAARALEIFHDPLAKAMRRAVIARLFPDLPDMAAG